MKYFFLLLFPLIFFIGCSYRQDRAYDGSNKITEQAVANTKKIQISKDKKPIIFATITYLDSIKNGVFVDKNLEQFVIGFHFVNTTVNEKYKKLDPKNIVFKIDEKTEGVSVDELDADNPILKIIPASTPWSQYFLVQTPKILKDNIKFSVQIFPYSQESLSFQKDH